MNDMKREKISEIISSIDQKYVDKAAARFVASKTVSRIRWLKWGSLAACFAVLVIAGALVLPSLLDGGSETVDNQYYAAFSDSAIVWPWEYKTNCEKFTSVNFNGKEYDIHTDQNIPIEVGLLGEVLGSCEAKGEDPYTDKKYTEIFEVRSINGISAEKMIAAGKENEYYVYKFKDETMPATFGELLDFYGLAQTLRFNRFTVCEGNENEYFENKYFKLNDDAYIWQVLYECREAVPIESDDGLSDSLKNYLSFTVTSDALGIYKRYVKISTDGYLETNVFDYEYVYRIGEDAAAQIINYAKSSSDETDPEPYELTVSGTLTEIKDGYILIDNTVLCANKEDGVVYKILTDDIRMRRYIEFAGIKVGDTVQVKYRGAVSDGNTISGAYSMNKGKLFKGDMIIPD